MALFTYSVKYRFVCEKCGKQTDWLSYSVTQDAGSLKSVAEEMKIWANDVAKSTLSSNVVDTMSAIMNTDHADEVPIEIYTKDNQRIKFQNIAPSCSMLLWRGNMHDKIIYV